MADLRFIFFGFSYFAYVELQYSVIGTVILPHMVSVFCCMLSILSLCQSQSVWPDLANFHHFSEILTVFGTFWYCFGLVFANFCTSSGNFYANGQIFNDIKGQRVKKYSHLVTLVPIRETKPVFSQPTYLKIE